MSDLREAIASWTRFVADLRDELPHERWSELVKMDSHLVDAAGRWADLLDVVEGGGRIIAETPCEHGEVKAHPILGQRYSSGEFRYCTDAVRSSHRRVVLGDET